MTERPRSAAPAPPPPPDEDAFREAMGRFATGVSVVTTRVRGAQHGITVNSLASVSLQPLLVLCCVEVEARFHEHVIEAGVWGVSLLAERDEPVSRWFATRGRPVTADFDRFAFRPGPITGVPLLGSALATVECRTAATHLAGDHTILVGEAVGVEVPAGDAPATPLLYYAGGYHALGAPTPSSRRDALRMASSRPPV